MSPTPLERRRFPRMHLQVPLFLRGRSAGGEDFLELTKAMDISATGALVASPHLLRPNAVVSLTVPAPPSPGAGVMGTANAPIQARVRRVQNVGELYLVGLEFLKPLD